VKIGGLVPKPNHFEKYGRENEMEELLKQILAELVKLNEHNEMMGMMGPGGPRGPMPPHVREEMVRRMEEEKKRRGAVPIAPVEPKKEG